MAAVDEAVRSAVASAAALRERWQCGLAYNPLSARTAQDPYPVYAALRARSPVHRSRLLDAWLFTRHADIDANRDPAVFADPDRLDVGRSGGAHLSFGGGIHHCLGRALTRLECRVALEMLLERFASIRPLAARPRFRRTVVLRGLESLPVRCARA